MAVRARYGGPLEGSRRYSLCPNSVEKTVHGTHSGSNSIWWNPDSKSIEEKYVALSIVPNRSSMSGSGNLSSIVSSFSFR